MLHDSISTYLPQLELLFQKHKIKNASVFGSALTNKFNDKSDVDFIVNLQEGLDPVEAGDHLWDLGYELQQLLKRDVDLITERSLKNPIFIKEINNTKQEIYGQQN